MRHRPNPDSRCRRPGKPRTSGPKPACGADDLAGLIQEFKWESDATRKASRQRYQDFATLDDAIRHATGAVGRVPDHQRRVGRSTLKTACNRLLRHKAALQACRSFADLLGLIAELTAGVRRFGPLAVYDTASRLGVYLDLAPELVYLHAGTKEGAKALGLDTRRGHLTMEELPAPFRQLAPWECEDFLCIHKARLARLAKTRTPDAPAERAGHPVGWHPLEDDDGATTAGGAEYRRSSRPAPWTP